MVVEGTPGAASSSELYTTSALVGELVNTESVPASELTNHIIRAQDYIDGKLRRVRQVPWTASTVPDQVRLMATWYAAQYVLEATFFGEIATGGAGDLTAAREYGSRADAIMNEILGGNLTLLDSNDAVVEYLTSEENFAVIQSATPAASMTPPDGMELVDLGAYSIVIKLTDAGGTPSGPCTLYGRDDQGWNIEESFYFDQAETKYSDRAWKKIISLDAGNIIGTTPLIEVDAVKKRGSDSGGMMAVD